jgi:hypothetical protein
MKYREWISGFFWLAVGVFLTVWSNGYRVGTIIKPGPGFFPLGVGLLLILFSLVLLIKEGRRRSPKTGLPPFAPGGWKKVACTVIILVASVVFFERLGFLITFFLLVVSTMRWAGSQTWKRTLVTALCSSLGVYLVFVLMLKQQLPRGPFGI